MESACVILFFLALIVSLELIFTAYNSTPVSMKYFCDIIAY